MDKIIHNTKFGRLEVISLDELVKNFNENNQVFIQAHYPDKSYVKEYFKIIKVEYDNNEPSYLIVNNGKKFSAHLDIGFYFKHAKDF